MKFKGIIFDIDGTLTSTNELIFNSFNHIWNKYFNKVLTPEEIISLFGPTEDEIIDKLYGEKAFQAKNDYYEYYRNNHHIADLYEGIKEILQFLKDENILLSIYTGKGRKAALITLEELDILKYFDLIVTGDDIISHKPSPEGIELFINKFNLKKDEVLMIGDAPADVKAARSAGVNVASVVWDSYSKEKVLSLNSDYYFEKVNELYNFLSKISINN